MKRLFKLLTAGLAAAILLTLAACSSGYKVNYVLPDGATGSAPAATAHELYDQVTLPSVDSNLNGAPQTGWTDASGNFYANGSSFSMGSMDMTLTAAYEAKTIAESFCENPGTMNFGGRLIGPTAAYTQFRADGTWIADAEGVACFSHFEGTWSLSDSGELSMVLAVQDGVERNTPVEITSDGKTFTYTLTHPGDRGGLKYHVNHISAYALITSYNEATGSSVAAPEEPTFTVTFVSGKDDAAGETASLSGKLGESIAMPECGFTREGAEFAGWSVDQATYQAGDSFTIQGYDVTVTAKWSDEGGGGGWG